MTASKPVTKDSSYTDLATQSVVATPGGPTLGPILDQTGHPKQVITFTAFAFGGSGGLVYSLINSPPAAASIDPATGVFTWTPQWTDLGTRTITVKVVDSAGLSDVTTCTVTVANQAPVLNPLSDITGAHPLQPLTVPVSAFDLDGDDLTFSLVSNPTGMSINKTSPNTANLLWTPTWSQLGAFAVVVKVSDQGNLFDIKTFTITVVNRPPTLNPLPDITGAHPTVPVAIPISAFDPDGDDLTFTLLTFPAGMTITKTGTNSAVVNWTPTWSQIGAFTVTVKAADQGGLSDVQSCTVTVGNQPPTLSPLSDVTDAHPMRPTTFPIIAFDADGDDLTFTLISPPTGMSITKTGPSSAVVNWTPTTSQIGSFSVAVKVADQGGLSDVKTCVVTVGNQAPILGPLLDMTVAVGTHVSFLASAFDPDGDAPLTFSLISPPAGASIPGGNFSWTPTTAGAFTITVRVADPGGLSDVKSCTITVTA